jgi:hypothetical protein
VDAYALAHGIHYAIVAAGVVGILALLVPQQVERLTAGRRPQVRAPRDVHEARVMQLRAEIASGSLGRRTAVAPAPVPALPHTERVLLPAAFVGSAAAAGVHAAMAPSHLQHGALTGAFFVVAAIAQITWAAALVLGASRTLLLAGAALNTAFIGLWAVTRTLGLPTVLPDPEAVGPWDLSCVVWQVVVVVACLRLLGSASGPADSARLPAWHRWDDRTTLFAIGSAALLAALSFSGFSG